MMMERFIFHMDSTGMHAEKELIVMGLPIINARLSAVLSSYKHVCISFCLEH